MEDHNLFLSKSTERQITSVLKTNQYTEKYGITLTKTDAQLLVQECQDSLKAHQRVEFGESILPQLIFTFCDSPYIYQDNFVDTIGRLQDIFYLYKNEFLDELNDGELLDYMKEAFDGDCQGSLDYLEETVLERLARSIRRDGNHSY